METRRKRGPCLLLMLSGVVEGRVLHSLHVLVVLHNDTIDRLLDSIKVFLREHSLQLVQVRVRSCL